MTTKHMPVFHHGGSGRPRLIADWTDAIGQLNAAIVALASTRPNGRDYPNEDELRGAIAEHEERLTKLRLVLDDLDALRRHARSETK